MNERAAPAFPAVVIGGSAGALDPLRQIASGFPPSFPAAIFIANHVPPASVSALPHLIGRSGPLFAAHAIDGAPIGPGTIIVAPPDRHLILEDGIMRVTAGPMENNSRPSIDVLFRSAARLFGPAACGVLLSGALDDGVAGLAAIRNAGGAAFVQDPEDAEFGDLPLNAIRARAVDAVLPSVRIAAAILGWLERSPAAAGGRPQRDERQDGVASVFTCPDCGGTLWELDEGSILRFRCRTGHGYSGKSMLQSQQANIESALYSALRALQERRDLLKRLSRRSRANGESASSRHFDTQLAEVEADFERISTALESLLSSAANPT